MSALDTLLDAGITYRQIDTWSHNNWIRPIHDGGQGRRREWPAHEIAIALLMKRLTDIGIAAGHAARIARQVEDTRRTLGLGDAPISVNLGGGIRITVTPATQEAAA